MNLKFKKIAEFKKKKSLLLVGFPGIGQIAKIVANLAVNEMKAKKIYAIYSDLFPNAVTINKDDLVEKLHFDVYSIENLKGEFQNLIIFTSDFIIREDKVMNEISGELLKFFEKDLKVSEVLTIAGIGLDAPKEKPSLFVTSNFKEALDSAKTKLKIKKELNSYVNRITGMNGLMLLSNVPSTCILIETFNHPFYIGLKEAKEVIKAIKKLTGISFPSKTLNKEIKEIEKQVKTIESKEKESHQTSYIG